MGDGFLSAVEALALTLPVLQILGGSIVVAGVILEFFFQTELSQRLARPFLVTGILLFAVSTLFRLV